MESATYTLTRDPLWPWSMPDYGLPALALVVLFIAGITVWTYRGARNASRRRVAILLGLRLLALILACLLALRPSVAYHSDQQVASSLILVLDVSESMTIQDEYNNQSRGERLHKIIKECEPILKELEENQKINVILYQFAGEVSDFDPQGKPTGKRTDFGGMLKNLQERHGREKNLRGLLIVSDGADNGTRFQPLAEAAKWRTLPCPIHTFSLGKPTTADRQNDLALTNISTEPAPVPIKNKLTVKCLLDAPGFDKAPITVRLLIDDKEVLVQKETVQMVKDQEIRVSTDAPDKPGEIKVTLKVDPLPGEMSKVNNEVSTYATVTKEGVSVLFVDRPRFPEPQLICDALAKDPRIRLFTAWRRSDEPSPDQGDLFQFDKQHYDVIVLGDLSAKRFAAGNAKAINQVHEVVRDGTGFLMMGGYETFANSDWNGTDLEKLLPVDLDAIGQIEEEVKIQPTLEGVRHYIMRQADGEKENQQFWDKLPKLTGMTRLGKQKAGAFVLAKSETGADMLVGQTYGKGRVLAFAGDTTWRWQRLGQPQTQTGVEAHNRFWRQLVLWLAKQDEAEGNVWVKPLARRLRAGETLKFTVGVRGKGGVDLKDGKFDVRVVGPDKSESAVPTALEKGEEQGSFWNTEGAGEYRLVVRGRAKDSDSQEVTGEATARFLIYQGDAELSRRAADHDFLARLANAGGGKAFRAEELTKFLRDLQKQPQAQANQKTDLWPDWRHSSRSGFSFIFFMLFATVLSLEWFLRRYWGMV